MADVVKKVQESILEETPAQEESTDWKAEARKWETRAKAKRHRYA